MKLKLAVLALLCAALGGSSFAQTPPGGYTSPAASSGGGITSVSSIPGQPGLNAVPVTSGLMAEYRMLATETPATLVDYSGNSNNATGTVGTAPTIIAGSGGVTFAGAGAIQLPAALNSALTVQIVTNGTYNGNGGAILAGNGAAGNLLLLTVTQITGMNDNLIQSYGAGAVHNMRLVAARIDVAPAAGVIEYPRIAVQGLQNIAWTMNGAGPTDVLYVNGVSVSTSLIGGGGSVSGNGHQTSGNYQLGGIASAGCTNWSAQLCNYLTGNIFYAVFYNRILSATEIQQNTVFINNQLAARNVNMSPYAPIITGLGVTSALAVDGDSLSCGACASVTPLPVAPWTAYLFNLNQPWGITNQALGGRRLDLHLIPEGVRAIDPLYWPYADNNLVVVWGGTNDSIDSIPQYCNDRHKVGWKCLIASMYDGVGDARKNTEGAWVRQHWREFADGLVDLASDPVIGANGANANVTDVFTTDTLHCQDNCIINHEAPLFKRAINRLYGNHDFSTATVYVAAALAATATTSVVGSGVTNTYTFAATPANCQAGNWMNAAGITPAGFNGVWYITSRTATTVVAHNFPSQTNLGTASVQGTVVCPQQQDADEYQIVNFGAGNYSLQTCMGLTGQNIYIRNINGTATTLLPWASETITGAGATPTTLALNTTAILQSQLVSSAAAGCNWVRLQ